MTTKREELTMRVTYEPNRYSATYLMDAYEALAPTVKLAIPDSSAIDETAAVEPAINHEGEVL